MPKRKISLKNYIRSEYDFTWRIKNYSFCNKEKGDRFSSPPFSVENLCVGQWYLTLYPKGVAELEDDANFLSCFLAWEPHIDVSETPAISYCLEIANKTGGVILKRRDYKSCVFTKKANALGVRRFIKVDELEAEMNKWKEDVLVLRCRIKCEKLKKQTIYGSVACTTIEVDRRFLEWNVKIPMLLLYSESIILPFSDSYTFEIILMENFSIFIYLNKCLSREVPRIIKFKLAVHDEHDNKITSKCAEHLFKTHEAWKFPQLLTKDVLEVCKVDSFNYNFKLKCKICIPNGENNSHIRKLNYITSACVNFFPKGSSVSTLQTDFQNLYNSKQNCDITIRVGNDEFPAHKLVLRMRSPVFTAMFDHEMLENGTGVVYVTDIDGATMKYFLEFLYSGKVNKMSYESAKKLILAGDKYNVPSLVNECVSFLKEDMSVQNVLDIISIAVSLNCECLKTCAFHFVKVNVTKILQTSYWTDWMKENIILASDILSKLYMDVDRKYK